MVVPFMSLKFWFTIVYESLQISTQEDTHVPMCKKNMQEMALARLIAGKTTPLTDGLANGWSGSRWQIA